MKRINLIALLIIALGVLPGCKKDDLSNVAAGNGTNTTGNNNTSNNNSTNNTGGGAGNNTSGAAKMDYQLKAVNTSGSLRTTGGTISWTSGTATPDLIKFEAKKGGSEIEYKSANTLSVDLMSSSITFGSFTIPVGTYEELELKIQFPKKSSATSLKLEGKFSDVSSNTPVVFELSDEAEIKTEQENITVDSSFAFTSITTFDLAGLTSGVTEDMMQKAVKTNGNIIISVASNKDIYQIILNNFKNRRHHMEVEHHHK